MICVITKAGAEFNRLYSGCVLLFPHVDGRDGGVLFAAESHHRLLVRSSR